MIDFFPLWIDTQSIQALDSGNRNRITYRLRQEDGALNYVYTDLTPGTAGDFLTVAAQTYGLFGNEWAHEARAYNVPAAGVILSRGFVDLMHEDPQKGVLLFEGCGATDKPLVIEVFHDDDKVYAYEFPLSIGGVEDMYRFHNFRDPPGLPERLDEPVNLPDSELGDKNMDVFMVHGFLVPQNESRAWGSEFFKRLWQEGSNARFHNVTWSSDTGLSISYEQNVHIAFQKAAAYAARVNSIKSANQSEVVVMAHSLGNVLTSAAISEHEMQVDKYFALNGAVPAEAYASSMADVRTNALNRLLHPDWRGYKPKTWASNWHQLFQDPIAFPDDDRANLTWQGRFAAAAPVLYNFWSSGDEVLEIASTADISVASGIEWDWSLSWWPVSLNARRYVWHKQALFKGRNIFYGTGWAGWGFYEWLIGGKVYSRSEANALDDDTLRVNPVFHHDPSAMFSSNIDQSKQTEILARGIPELSFPIGVTDILDLNVYGNDRNVDMHVDLRRGDELWPQRNIDFNDSGERSNRWLHTDLMALSHFYTHRLFEAIVTKGNMKGSPQ